MSPNDLSDEARDKFIATRRLDDHETFWFWEKHLQAIWDECRRRAEVSVSNEVLAEEEEKVSLTDIARRMYDSSPEDIYRAIFAEGWFRCRKALKPKESNE